jgi:hypothetical protein
VRRPPRGFPVSGAQGMGNRETATDSLISCDLTAPRTTLRESVSGKPESSASVAVPVVVVQRHFRPDEAFCDELVEVLYSLLMDPPSNDQAPRSDSPELTCFSGAPE